MSEVKWKKCPKCGGFIPENWNIHKKCGWNKPVIESEKSQIDDVFDEVKAKSEIIEITKDCMKGALIDTLQIVKELGNEQVFNTEAIQKIATTLFITRMRMLNDQKR